MPLAYHVVMGMYGFWLPNDPRGSWSRYVGSDVLFEYGHATKTEEIKSLAHRRHDRQERFAVKQKLKYPTVVLDGGQAWLVAAGFADMTRRWTWTILACAILPEHVHLVIRSTNQTIASVVSNLKCGATLRLLRAGRHPFVDLVRRNGKVPSLWARASWRVFLDTEDEIRHAIAYVEQNPIRDRKPPQNWSFVTSMDS